MGSPGRGVAVVLQVVGLKEGNRRAVERLQETRTDYAKRSGVVIKRDEVRTGTTGRGRPSRPRARQEPVHSVLVIPLPPVEAARPVVAEACRGRAPSRGPQVGAGRGPARGLHVPGRRGVSGGGVVGPAPSCSARVGNKGAGRVPWRRPS